jgi:hypothetical protein
MMIEKRRLWLPDKMLKFSESEVYMAQQYVACEWERVVSERMFSQGWRESA